jgi:hypothetical protein
MIFSVWEHPNFRVEGRESRWHHGCRLRVVSSDAVATVVVAQEVSGSASRPYDALLAQQEEGSFNQVNQSPAVPSKNCHRRLGPCTEKSPHQAVTPTATLVGTFHADCLRYSICPQEQDPACASSAPSEKWMWKRWPYVLTYACARLLESMDLGSVILPISPRIVYLKGGLLFPDHRALTPDHLWHTTSDSRNKALSFYVFFVWPRITSNI